MPEHFCGSSLFLIVYDLFHFVFYCFRIQYDEAREYVERARKCLATELAALVSLHFLSL